MVEIVNVMDEMLKYFSYSGGSVVDSWLKVMDYDWNR